MCLKQLSFSILAIINIHSYRISFTSFLSLTQLNWHTSCLVLGFELLHVHAETASITSESLPNCYLLTQIRHLQPERMKQEEGAVRLILAAAEFSSFTYSQLTKTWHRALAAVLDCSSWWLAYPPPLFPRHRSARSVPGSLTPKVSAAMCRHMAWCNWDQQNDTSANYPEKRWINAGSCRPQPCLLLSQEFAARLTAADTAKCV